MVDVENVWLYLRKSRSNHIKLFKDFKEALYLCSKDPTEKEIRSLWDKEKGLVTLATFTDIVSSLPDISERELLSAFKLFDVNSDGSLSLDELAIMLTKLGDRMSGLEVKKIFEQLDVNNDSKLDYKEFCGLYTQTNKQMAHVIDHVVNQKLEPQKSEPKETEKEKEVGKEKKREIDKETKKAIEKEKRKKEEDEVKKEKETKTKLGLDPEKSIRGSKSLSDLEPKAGRLRKSKVEVEEENPKQKEEEVQSKKKVEEKTRGEERVEPFKMSQAEEKANAKVSEFRSFEIEGETTSDETTSDGSEETSDESESESETEEETEKSEKATDFHSWPNNNIRGCIYAGARGDWTTHQYTLNLSKASNVCVMISHLAQTKGPKNQADLSVYVLEKGGAKAKYLTNKVVDDRSCFMGELAAGEYTLMPHSSSCTFVNAEVLPPTPVDVNNGSKLTTQAIKVFTDIFHCLDLNGDMLLSRQEFELFHIVSSGESLSDAMWNVMGENFEMDSGKITLAGFMKLHEMALEDTEGGEEEIRDTLSSMGYNSALQLVKACPYHIDVYSECEATVTLASLLALTNNPLLERALVGLTQQHGSELVVGDSAVLHLYTLPWRSSAAVTNKTPTPLRIEVNTTSSENCLENPPYAKHILTVPANRTVMSHHFTPEYRDKPFLPLITIKALPPKETAKPKPKPVEPKPKIVEPKPKIVEPKPKIVEPKPEKEEIIKPKPEPERASIDLPKYESEKDEKKERPKSSKPKKGLLSKAKSSKTSKGKSKSSTDL